MLIVLYWKMNSLKAKFAGGNIIKIRLKLIMRFCNSQKPSSLLISVVFRFYVPWQKRLVVWMPDLHSKIVPEFRDTLYIFLFIKFGEFYFHAERGLKNLKSSFQQSEKAIVFLLLRISNQNNYPIGYNLIKHAIFGENSLGVK